VPASGPWQGKQFVARIGRTIAWNEIGSSLGAAGAAAPGSCPVDKAATVQAPNRMQTPIQNLSDFMNPGGLRPQATRLALYPKRRSPTSSPASLSHRDLHKLFGPLLATMRVV